MYVTDVGADRKQLWRPIWSSDCKCCTPLRLELCSIPTSITMPGNNGQHGAPIFKPPVGLARTPGRGESLLWAGLPGYDARAVLPLGQGSDIRGSWILQWCHRVRHIFSSISCIIHRLIDTRLKDESSWETMRLCIHCQWKMRCPCFIWRLHVEEWTSSKGDHLNLTTLAEGKGRSSLLLAAILCDFYSKFCINRFGDEDDDHRYLPMILMRRAMLLSQHFALTVS